MDNKTTRFEKVCAGACIAILCFFAVTIAIRFLSKQILIDKLHMDNALTRIIWFDCSMSEETTSSVVIDWEKMYPFNDTGNSVTDLNDADSDKLSHVHGKIMNIANIVYSLEEKISSYTKGYLIGHNYEVYLAKKYNACLGFEGIPDFSNGVGIIYLDNGYFTDVGFAIKDEDINEIADSVADFSDYLSGQGIDFCYVNAGLKVCPYDKQTIYVDFEYSNENEDALLNALDTRGINYLDMREKMIEDGLNWYDSYYITDHHWKTETGLWAAKQLALYLNNEFGYNFNAEQFEPYQYEMKTTENFWLGSQGRFVTFANADLESYTKIIPKYDTSFHIEIPTRNVSKDGSYEETLFDNDIYNAVFDYSENDQLTKEDAYNSVTWRNDALGIIRNNGNNSNMGKKILFLQDSFSWYSTTFLACDIEAIDIIHPGVFTGSIRCYIEETKPDMVVMMMCERNINPIDGQGHSETFELK